MSKKSRSAAGFTLAEVLAIAAIIGILAGIAVPSWLSFVGEQRLSKSIDEVYWAVKKAQSNAKTKSETWQASFRESVLPDGTPVTQWAIHPANLSPHLAEWHNLDPHVRIVDLDIDPMDLNESTFYTYPSGVNEGTRRVRFNFYGNTNGQLGRLTLGLRSENHPQRKLRCLIVSTLLGATRVSENQSTPSSGRYCY